MVKLTTEELKFLKESNAIEREYSRKALTDAIKAWKFAKEQKRLDLQEILKIHQILMQRLRPGIAGKIRNCVVYIGGERKDQSNREIKESLYSICLVNPNTEKTIKKWHVAFEAIHPFEDGNGRVGRIIMNWQRLKAKLPLLIIHEGKEQEQYYGWFR